MLCLRSLACLACLAATVASAQDAAVRFDRQVLTDQYFCDGVNCGDINRDGRIDIVAGPHWYAGPEFHERHEFYPAVAHDPAKSPSDSLYTYLDDFNADGWLDILVLGRVHLHAAYWYENPRGASGHWPKHYVFERILGETPPWADLNGDGRRELVCHWEGRWGYVAPEPAGPADPWRYHPVTAAGEYEQFYHGTGVGDVDGDGRNDLILNEGWWSPPAEGAADAEWTPHPFRFARKGGAQMFAYDVDGDRDQDVLTALDAHGWGLAWFEQTRRNGAISFVEHPIMGDRAAEATYGVAFSQPHALDLADINGNGLKDLVVGKRRWAHGPTGDIEPDAAPVVYWFELVRDGSGAHFRSHLIDDRSGVGLQIAAEDVTGDGRADVLTASKLGVFLFVNRAN